jgi:hypothetical protein
LEREKERKKRMSLSPLDSLCSWTILRHRFLTLWIYLVLTTQLRKGKSVNLCHHWLILRISYWGNIRKKVVENRLPYHFWWEEA